MLFSWEPCPGKTQVVIFFFLLSIALASLSVLVEVPTEGFGVLRKIFTADKNSLTFLKFCKLCLNGVSIGKLLD